MNPSHIRVHTRSGVLTLFTVITIAIVGFISASVFVDFKMIHMARQLVKLPSVIGRTYDFDWTIVDTVLLELLTSVALAFVTLVATTIISVVLSFLAAENCTPHPVLAVIIKGFCAFIRAVPFTLFALLVIETRGYGNTSGFIALLFPTTGLLVKIFIGSIEDLGMDAVEAMEATGASWLNVVIFGLLPMVMTSLLSWVALRFEGNIYDSVSLGIVGVGGVGLMLIEASTAGDQSATTTIAVIICIFMLILEAIMTRLKNKIISGTN